MIEGGAPEAEIWCATSWSRAPNVMIEADTSSTTSSDGDRSGHSRFRYSTPNATRWCVPRKDLLPHLAKPQGTRFDLRDVCGRRSSSQRASAADPAGEFRAAVTIWPSSSMNMGRWPGWSRSRTSSTVVGEIAMSTTPMKGVYQEASRRPYTVRPARPSMVNRYFHTGSRTGFRYNRASCCRRSGTCRRARDHQPGRPALHGAPRRSAPHPPLARHPPPGAGRRGATGTARERGLAMATVRQRGSVPVMPRRMMRPWPTASAQGASHTAGRLAGDLGALASGAVLPLGFAPFDFGVLAIPSLAVLFALWTGVSAGRAARRGWLYGLGAFGVGVSWVQISVHQFASRSRLSVSVTVAFVAILAHTRPWSGSWPSSVPVPGARVRPGPAALWCAGEWVRGWLFKGFPGSVSATPIDAPLGGLARSRRLWRGARSGLVRRPFVQSSTGRAGRFLGGLCLSGRQLGPGARLWTRPAQEPSSRAHPGNIAQA